MQLVKPTISDDCKIFEGNYDPTSDWREDPAGYLLIRINDENNMLEAGFCIKDNVIEILVSGTSAEEVYHTFTSELTDAGITLYPEHYAYLGKELYKAFVAKKLGKKYVQDEDLGL
jgi:hypothetical protein